KRNLTILRNRDFREKALKHSSGKEEFRGNRTFREWGFIQINDQHKCRKKTMKMRQCEMGA
uniref:Uncharacterized protein n=1 Tax=Romanomermis culicivorax TaxID=13658 RepID=A0A915I8R3_ROMCU